MSSLTNSKITGHLSPPILNFDETKDSNDTFIFTLLKNLQPQNRYNDMNTAFKENEDMGIQK